MERLIRDQRAQEEAKEKGKKKEGREAEAQQVLNLELVKTDPDKLYPIIYYALKRTLKEWEDWMDERPGELHGLPCVCSVISSCLESVKRTMQGKLAAATQKQSAEYLKPLFKLLRARVRLRIKHHNPLYS